MWRHSNKFLLIVFACCLTSCFTKKIAFNTDFASWYNAPVPEVLHPQVKVFHYRTDSTAVYFGISRAQLNFIFVDSFLKSQIQIKFKLWSLQQPSALTDSGTVNFNLLFDEAPVAIAQLKMHAPTGLNYRCEYQIKDLNNNLRCNDEVLLKKDGTKCEQYFLVKKNDEVFFNTYANATDSLQFYYKDEPAHQLTLKYYVPLFAPALPSFSNAVMQNTVIQPDTVYQISSEQKICLPEEGVYKIMAQRYDTAGIIIMRFHLNYPEVTQPGHLIFPLRYITKNIEYDHLMNAADPKIAIDSLWLRVSSFDEDLAKKLISTFYNRVQDANLWFTTYKEGWMTDRGMILVVYGRPDHVYRKSDEEDWIYDGSYNQQPVTFSFLKNENSFSPNDFVLQRNYYYISSWNLQVYRWRHGLIDEL